MRWTVQLWALIAALLSISPAHAAPPGEQKPIVVDYQPGVDNVQLVTVILNGSTTATFLLDTGTNISLISPELVSRMKLPYQARKSPAATNRNKIFEGSSAVQVDKLQLGGVSLSNVTLVQMKTDSMSPMLGRKIDGLIGTNILSDYAVLFDFQQHRLTFCKNGKLSLAQRKVWGMDKAYSMRIENIGNDIAYSAHVRINGTVGEDLLIDTGAARTIVSFSVARKLKLTSLGDLTSFSVHDDHTDHLALVDKLDLGDFTTGATTLRYPAGEGGPLPPLLGMDLMMQHRVLMDFPAKIIYFLPVERKAQVIAFSAKTDFAFPLFDAKLADGKVHILGWSVGARSTLDNSLAATWPAVPAELDPSPSPDSKTVASKVDYPTGKPLLDSTDFSLASYRGNTANVANVGWLGRSGSAGTMCAAIGFYSEAHHDDHTGQCRKYGFRCERGSSHTVRADGQRLRPPDAGGWQACYLRAEFSIQCDNVEFQNPAEFPEAADGQRICR